MIHISAPPEHLPPKFSKGLKPLKISPPSSTPWAHRDGHTVNAPPPSTWRFLGSRGRGRAPVPFELEAPCASAMTAVIVAVPLSLSHGTLPALPAGRARRAILPVARRELPHRRRGGGAGGLAAARGGGDADGLGAAAPRTAAV